VRAWEAAGERFILAFWHRHLLLMPYAYRGRRISVMISQSRDGELIARTVARFGIGAARGSSSRGGLAGMRSLLRQAEEGWDLAGRLRSWDRFLVPLPFSAVHFVYGEPLAVPRRGDLDAAARELKGRLDGAEAEAERLAQQG